MKLKNDKYSKARGGNSHLLEIACSKCAAFVVQYQKDGIGSLLRMYADRIYSPERYRNLEFASSKSALPNIVCPKCANLIAVPMIYQEESRLAFRMIRGAFVKKKL